MTFRQLAPSRADIALPKGITPKVLRARSEKAITEIEKRIEALAGPYIDVDNSVEGAVRTLQAAFDAFRHTIEETQRYLEEAA